MKSVRCEVYYAGRVQGVGFRFTVRELAARLGIDGFVRNLPDGGVTLVAEGTRHDVDRLLSEVRATMGRYIKTERETRSDATGEFHGFEIRY